MKGKLLCVFIVFISLCCVSTAAEWKDFLIQEGKCIFLNEEGKGDFPINLNKFRFDTKDNVYAANIYQCIIKKFDKNGKFQKTFGKHGSGPGELNIISDFFILKDRLYVKDMILPKTVVFSTDGRFLEETGSFKTYYTFHASGSRIYATYFMKQKGYLAAVLDEKFKTECEFFPMEKISDSYDFRFPPFMDTDNAGKIYAIYPKDYRIFKFDKNCKMNQIFGVHGKIYNPPPKALPTFSTQKELAEKFSKYTLQTSLFVISEKYIFIGFTKGIVDNKIYFDLYLKSGRKIAEDVPVEWTVVGQMNDDSVCFLKQVETEDDIQNYLCNFRINESNIKNIK